MKFLRPLFLLSLLGSPTLIWAQAATPDTSTPFPSKVLRAQYSWGYVGMEGEGKGTLSLLLEPHAGKAIIELHGLGERLLLLTGDRATGYHLQIPRQSLDQTVPNFSALPLPFLPKLGDVQALHKLLVDGEGAGVSVTKRDATGPLKLRYRGQDEHGKDVMVWMERTRWEQEIPTAP